MQIRTRKGKDSKIPLLSFLIVVVTALSIGFSAVSTTLKINGTAKVTGMSWKIEFQNLSEATLTGSAEKVSDPVISEDKTELKSYNVNFLEPGDSISYSFQIANNGTINAKLSEIIKDNVSCEGYGSDEQAAKDATNVCANLEYSLKYKNEEEHFDDSGSSKTFSNDIEVNDILNPGDVKDMILTLKYKSPVDGATIEEPKDDVSISGLGIKLTYSQVKTPTGESSNPDTPVISTSFAEDTWETIAKNVQNGNTSNYHVGDTKEISLKNYGTHTVRIANMSTPDECSTENFSQTACGFVVEFADIITEAKLNNNYTNVGGWASSSISKSLNDESDSTSFFNALPSDLKGLIEETTVISGHGSTSGESNSITTNKLYLLSTKEVWENGTTSNAISSSNETGRDVTRQLDYYKEKGVSTTTFTDAIKKLNGTASLWWLRSAMGTNDFQYYAVSAEGDWNGSSATIANGISPAFRFAYNPIETTSQFADDSWETIAENVKEGNTSNYHVGDTKKITISGIEGDFTVRIANMSTPDECKNTNFSQSACGFVMEIPELIGELAMNNSDTVEGGWPASTMRYMINAEGFLNMLPSDLKNQLTTTKVVSYKDRTNSEYYTSNDKVYLASTFEYISSNGIEDTTLKLFDDYGVTRQLDFYKEATENGTFDAEMTRTYNGVANSPYWVRSIVGSSKFYNVGTDATDNTSHLSISPLFRFEGPSSTEEVAEPKSFAEDTWATIANAVKTGNTDKYNVGDTKEIKTSKYGVQTLRLVNKSTPSECNGDNFSQTACGFVVEFENILENRAMNSTTDLTGGWQSMTLRTYLNNDFFDGLPADLRNVMATTKTVTYNDRLNKTYYKSNDKVYIKAYGEIIELKPENIASDSNFSEDNTVTRPLDYYTSGRSDISLTKSFNGVAEATYWLRTIVEGSRAYAVNSTVVGSTGKDEYGVVPMFRITGEEEKEPTVETKSFAEDSWDTIYKAVKAGETDNYFVGDTKQVQLANLGTQTVKLVNKATPDECKNTNFSQSACGFVVEFVDIVANKPMNLTDTVVGGWAATNVRTYLNNEFFNELPDDLKNVVGTTKILSNKNITSKDKVYIKSYIEITSTADFNGDAQSIVDDYGVTRQLDYYKSVMANGSDSLSAEVTKSFNGVENASYWLRTIYTQESSSIFYPLGNGNDLTGMNSEAGVIPMFRITGGDEQDDTETGSFVDDSWETIANNVKAGKTSNYHVGDIKKIAITGAGEYNVRIVNMSTPSECKQSDFSQTACGFVLEISDIFTKIAMNSTDTVSGGWPGTSLRSELNEGMPQLLPAELASVVTDTKVVSYNDRSAGSLYTSTDKYYLPSALEYYPTTGYTEDLLNQFDDYGKTRQLDYYKTLSDAGTIDEDLKRSFDGNSDAPYWTRSIVNNTSFHYFGSNVSGVNATSKLGLVTLFRLEGPDDSTEVSSSFADDSWETIAKNVKAGNTSNYHVGDTKKIALNGIEGDFTVRIANMSTPSECKQSGFSQSACGFVLEIPDIITNAQINAFGVASEGWLGSYLRRMLAESMPKLLPSDLSAIVTDTNVVSYSNRSYEELYSFYDKYYIPSALEYQSTSEYTDDVLKQFSDYGKTRQLDYYKMQLEAGTLDNAIKRSYNGKDDAPYWTRTVVNKISFYYFGTVSEETDASALLGAVVLFRLEGADDYKEPQTAFEKDSWETISNNVKSGNTSDYKIGDTKIVDLGTYGKHKVRIANMSTPSECSNENFSQTACGFVVEFADTIVDKTMNSTNTNAGGWAQSDMHSFLNSETQTDSIINSLPADLKKVIINTKVVSGSGSGYTSADSVDKLYLLSTGEIWSGGEEEDGARDKTRQLDYYEGTTNSVHTKAIKCTYNSSSINFWWLRSAYRGSQSDFYFVNLEGSSYKTTSDATNERGVSPAFRIG